MDPMGLIRSLPNPTGHPTWFFRVQIIPSRYQDAGSINPTTTQPVNLWKNHSMRYVTVLQISIPFLFKTNQGKRVENSKAYFLKKNTAVWKMWNCFLYLQHIGYIFFIGTVVVDIYMTKKPKIPIVGLNVAMILCLGGERTITKPCMKTSILPGKLKKTSSTTSFCMECSN